MKKCLYIFLWFIMGLQLNFLAYAAIEVAMIRYAFKNGIILKNNSVFGYGSSVLPVFLQAALFIFFAVIAISAGFYFWKVIYVEKRYCGWGKKPELKFPFA